MIERFIRERGVTKLPSGAARGSQPFYQATAHAMLKEEHFAYRSPRRTNEENIAHAKILTMLQDLGARIIGESFMANAAQNRERLRQQAYHWFFSPKSDFEAWCDTAGFDPVYIREQAQKVYDEGLPQTRAAPRQGKRYLERKAYREKVKRRRLETVH